MSSFDIVSSGKPSAVQSENEANSAAPSENGVGSAAGSDNGVNSVSDNATTLVNDAADIHEDVVDEDVAEDVAEEEVGPSLL